MKTKCLSSVESRLWPRGHSTFHGSRRDRQPEASGTHWQFHWEGGGPRDIWASPVAQMVMTACNAGDPGSIPGSRRSPGEGNGSPPQYSCLENPMDRSLVGYSSWGHKESDRTDRLTRSFRDICHHSCTHLHIFKSQGSVFKHATLLCKWE